MIEISILHLLFYSFFMFWLVISVVLSVIDEYKIYGMVSTILWFITFIHITTISLGVVWVL